MDYAARYSHFIGDWDIGLSLFHGLSRAPRLLPNTSGTALALRYDKITQLGLDVQYTMDAWLWKFEGIAREGHGDTFAAMVGGFEYTFFQVAESDADLGVLAEVHLDGRDENHAPPTPFDRDLFLGTRLALNDVDDTQMLAGAVIDAEDGTLSFFLEAERPPRRFLENRSRGPNSRQCRRQEYPGAFQTRQFSERAALAIFLRRFNRRGAGRGRWPCSPARSPASGSRSGPGNR